MVRGCVTVAIASIAFQNRTDVPQHIAVARRCGGAQTVPVSSSNVAGAASRATLMSKIVRRAFQSTPARLEMRALGLQPRIPLGGAVLFLFGCGQVAIVAATLGGL
jgi:hypothetical protein